MIKELEKEKLINLNFHPSTLIFKDDLIVLSNFERVLYFPSMKMAIQLRKYFAI